MDEAVARLEIAYPTTFSSESTCFITYDYEPSFGDCPVICDATSCVGVAALARSINPTHPPAFIVPALYCCHQLPLESLLDDFKYGKASVQLWPQDLRSCIAAEVEVRQFGAKSQKMFVDMQMSPPCTKIASKRSRRSITTQGAVCSKAIASLHRAAILQSVFTLPNVLGPIYLCVRGFDLCTTCSDELEERIDRERLEFFNSLGKMFGYAPWPPSRA